MHVQIEFTPSTAAKNPALKGWRTSLNVESLHAVFPNIAVGDLVEIEGVPVQETLRVYLRKWTVMSDEITLLLVLQEQGEIDPL